MFARYQDNAPENISEELELSLDLYTCPMTRQIIRHPVLTSDGHRYELCYLLRYVQGGGRDSPLRAGLGGIFPVLYDSQWKELLDDLLPHHADRYPNYGHEGMVEEINARLTRPVLPEEAEEINETPIHVEIGNAVLKAFFYYLIFSVTTTCMLRELLPRSMRDNDAFSMIFILSAMMSMTAILTHQEARLRIDNNNEHGILGAITNRYYSLFKRQEPRPLAVPEFPAHRRDIIPH